MAWWSDGFKILRSDDKIHRIQPTNINNNKAAKSKTKSKAQKAKQSKKIRNKTRRAAKARLLTRLPLHKFTLIA